MAAKCPHLSLFSLYRRGPKEAGSKFIPWGKACAQCGEAFAKGAHANKPVGEGGAT